MQRDARKYLYDIDQAAALIAQFTAGKSFAHYVNDPMLRAALLEDLRAAGVRVENAPPEALEDFIASHAPPRDEPVLRQKGRTSKRNRAHARMLER